MVKTIAIVGTLDTKGDEVSYLKELIEARGHKVLLIDPGVLGDVPDCEQTLIPGDKEWRRFFCLPMVPQMYLLICDRRISCVINPEIDACR